MLTNPGFHRKRHLESLMDPAELVPHVEQGNHRNVVIELFAERVRKSGEAAVVHPKVQVLSLHVAGADVLWIGSSDNFDLLRAKTLRGAVALLSLRIVAVDLRQLRIVDVVCKGVGNSRQVHLMAVRGQLNPIRQAASIQGNVLREI